MNSDIPFELFIILKVSYLLKKKHLLIDNAYPIARMLMCVNVHARVFECNFDCTRNGLSMLIKVYFTLHCN